jgi:alpha-mannosidase
VQGYRDGEFQLDNGHMWIDGHVYPHAFFTPAEVRLIEAIGKHRHRVLYEVKTVRYHPEWHEGMQVPGYDDSKWTEAPVGLGTGRQFSEEVYRFTLPPAATATLGRERFFALRPLHPSKEAWPETTIYVNGRAVGALVRWHDYWALSSLMDPSRENQVTLRAFGIYSDPPRGFRQIAIVERDPAADRLYWNLRVLAEAASILPESEALHSEVKRLLRLALDRIDRVQLQTSIGQGQIEAVDREVEAGRLALEKTFPDVPSPARDFSVGLLYHAHHDTAWQWTVAHSRGKTERAVLNNLYLMDRYPDYRYLYTAAYHYQVLKEDRPDLYARVQEKARQGQWEANGGMWIEADVRLPGGESLVRQMLLGLDYFEREFGRRPEEHVLFLPDTFGHAPVMPQIMRGFGVDTLFAMRIRDVQNPHDVFRWQGIDGTQVLVNAITTPAWEYPYLPELHGRVGAGIGGAEIADRVSYSAPDPGPRRIFGLWETFRQKDATNNQIVTIGWGDGGGGGTEDHVEVARRVAELPWFPKLHPTDTFTFSREQMARWDRYPVYAEDIYTGFQRTFTRANRIKQENRAAERLLHDTEFLGAWAAQLGQPYDAKAVQRGWQTMLINHMHDIITGQSVPEVNDEAIARYDQFRQQVRPVLDRSLASIVPKVSSPGRGAILINTLGIPRSGPREIALPEGSGVADSTGRPLPVQRLDEKRALVTLARPIPSYGYEALAFIPSPAPTPETGLAITDRVLENRFLRVTLDANGEIVSLYDKHAARELVPAGTTQNRLLAVRSAAGGGPNAPAPTGVATRITEVDSLRVAEHGPLRAAWEIVRRHGTSTLRQRLVLAADSRRLEIECDIDWQEATELHADFPLDLKTTTALQGIQFGYQKQTTTRNNPVDAARSLLAVHDWIAIAEEDYGFGLLNDGRMGHDVKNGGIRIVLFTNQQVANANGDRGANRFTYSVFPYSGSIGDSGITAEARDLNHPVHALPVEPRKAALPGRFSMAEVQGAPTVILSEIKPAEDGDGVILRLYESAGRHATAHIAINWPMTSAVAANLREDGSAPLPVSADRITLQFAPFQIRTVRIR